MQVQVFSSFMPYVKRARESVDSTLRYAWYSRLHAAAQELEQCTYLHGLIDLHRYE